MDYSKIAKDPAVYGPLLNYFLNATSGGEDIPLEGLPLTSRKLEKRHGMSRKNREALCQFVASRSHRGSIRKARGGGVTVWAKRSWVYSTIQLARKKGLVGEVPHSPTEIDTLDFS